MGRCFHEKKGFTLAELLGVLVIIALLLILIIPSVINRLSNSSDEAKESSMQIIFDVTDQYIKEHPNDYPPGKSGRYCITIQNLIDDGKLVSPVIDITTGEDISDKSVMVTIYSSGNTDHELREGDDCENLASLPFIDFVVTPNGSSWVKQRIVKIIWPAIDGNYRARYRINNEDWIYVDPINSQEGGTIELLFNKSSASTPLEAQYLGTGDSNSSNIINSKIDIVNIDSISPKCTLRVTGTKGDNDWYTTNVTVDFGNNNSNLSDDLSGVNDYGISTSTFNTFGKINKQTQTTDIANVTYYGYVVDKAGNIGKCSTSFKKDATKPQCSITASGTVGNDSWYKSDVTVTKSTSDNLSSVASHGMSTNSSVSYNGTSQLILSKDTKGITYYGYVKDAAGNTNQCSKSVKRDITAPTVKFGINGITTATVSCTDGTSGVVGTKSWTVGLSGTSNRNVNASCTDYAGNTVNSSHTYKYSSCASGENTCKYGCETCRSCVGGNVWSNCAYTVPICHGCNTTSCITTNAPTCLGIHGGTITGSAGAAGVYCCFPRYDDCCTTTNQCKGGYVWSSCASYKYYDCKCSSCKTGHNTCKAGFKY